MFLTVERVVRRLWELRNYSQFDVIFLQRELFPFGPPLIEKLLKKKGGKIIFDYDDALFIPKPSKYNRFATWLRNSDKTHEIFSIADCVLAGNDYLRDIAARQLGDARTFYVAEDTDRIPMRPAHTQSGKLVIGWLGSKSTEKYLNLIRTPLVDCFRRIPNGVLRIVGGGDFSAEFPVEHREWSIETEIGDLLSFDIGIMPLPNEEWSLGKSGGKGRTYMAAGVPPVCTAIGYNKELIQHGRTGFLVNSSAEWSDTLVKLAESPTLRQEIGFAARRYVKTHFSVSSQAEKLRDILVEISNKQIAV